MNVVFLAAIHGALFGWTAHFVAIRKKLRRIEMEVDRLLKEAERFNAVWQRAMQWQPLDEKRSAE